jgi:6-phosphogluconolactonase
MSEDGDSLHAYTLEDSATLSTFWDTPRLPDSESGTGADVRVTPNGQFVYGTNRDSSNTIVAVNAADGLVIEHESTQGTIPRSLAMDPLGEFVVVANRGDQKIAIFDIESDGMLTHVLTETVGMTPFFVVVVQL